MFVRHCIRYSRARDKDVFSISNLDDSDIQRHVSSASGARIRIPVRRIGLLELRASRILAMGILPFCLVTVPLSIGSAVTFVHGIDAVWIKLAMVILREFLLLHLVYIPSVLIVQSREFRAALRRICRVRARKPNEQYN